MRVYFCRIFHLSSICYSLSKVVEKHICWRIAPLRHFAAIKKRQQGATPSTQFVEASVVCACVCACVWVYVWHKHIYFGGKCTLFSLFLSHRFNFAKLDRKLFVFSANTLTLAYLYCCCTSILAAATRHPCFSSCWLSLFVWLVFLFFSSTFILLLLLFVLLLQWRYVLRCCLPS